MAEFFKLLSTNTHAALAVLIVGILIAVTAVALYTIAFVQGRSISFWPPSIGSRPTSASTENSTLQPASSESAVKPARSTNPIVDRGSVLQGASGKPYHVVTAIYGGASATLFKARDAQGNSVIAKLFWRGLAPNSSAWELFQREQRAAEILQHRNIVRTLDRGLQSGYPFTIVEYMAGGTLRDWLETHNRLPGPDVLSIASQLADAIDYAHANGVLHRDIKPGNILFESGPQGRVALNDFGIAAILGAFEYAISAAAREFAGSPGYLAPELIQGNPTTIQADIYSFGAVLYEMIAGRLPFEEHHEVLAIIRAKVAEDPPDIRKFRPDTDERLAARLSQALSRKPAERPQSARGLLSGLEDVIQRL
jgi:serine/threonine-protein kinase